MARLGDICEILDSKRVPITASNRKAGIYPYYGANGVQDYVDDYIFDDELVLLAEDGGHFGSPDKPIAYRVSGKCWVNNHAHVLKPKTDLDVDYLCYSLMHRDVSNIVNGATRQKLTQADMREIDIPLLPLNEQKAIVNELNGVFDVIVFRKQQLAKLDELVKSRFIELMDSAELSEEVTVEQITERVKVGFVGTCEKYYTDASGIPMLRTGNITDHGIDMSDLKYVTLEFHDKNRKSQIRSGDLLIARHGSNGQANVYDGPEAQCLNAVVIVPNQNVAISTFLAGLINSPAVKEQIDRTLVGSTQHVVNTKSIANLVVRIPCLEVQEQYEAFVEQTDKSKFEIQKSLQQLETLKKALMQKYFG